MYLSKSNFIFLCSVPTNGQERAMKKHMLKYIAESFAGQTVGLVAPLCPAWHRYLFGHGQPLPGFEDAQEEEYRATAHGQWRGNDVDEFMQ
jgi:hypothetical protein